jgi:peptide/nickel transport system substrate-binding protein
LRSTDAHHRRRARRLAALAIGFGLVAAACSDKKDQDSVGGDTTAPAATTAAPTTTSGESPETTTADSTGSTTPATDGGDTATTLEPPATLPAPQGDPVYGGKLVVAGEAEVGAPWTPAAVQCDSYCQFRIRTFIEPLFVTGDDRQVHPFLGESITPNADYTQWTIKVRPGISFTDGTPVNADAVIENFNRTWTGLLVQGAMRDVAKGPDGKILATKTDDMTFTLQTGKNGDPNAPVPWPTFPQFLTAQPGFIASPTWLAAVDGNADLATQPVGTGPFVVQEFINGDRMTVVKNPNYWRKDANGGQLPYLDSIEFRVIQDAQVRDQALQAGDIDLQATSDGNIVSKYVDSTDPLMLQQNTYTETNYTMFHLTKPQLADQSVRCALIQAIDREDLVQVIASGFPKVANGPFSPGQDGYLEDTGLPTYDPDAAAKAIADWEAANGPLTLNYSTTPTGTTKATADYLQAAWTAVGVDVTQTPIEQSKLILNALLGSADFEAFGWRNHAGIVVDTQNQWWHGFGADAAGSQVADDAPNLNFGRLNDPVINDLLDQARSETDPAKEKDLAQQINREFAKQCWIMPLYWTTWGIVMKPTVQNVSRDTMPDGTGFLLDGAGFPGQVWLDAVWKTQ